MQVLDPDSVTWDQVFIFAKAFGILLAVGLVFNLLSKLYLLATSAPERNSQKYGTPYQFIGSDFIYEANKNYRCSVSNDKERTSDSTICYSFSVAHVDKNHPSFDINIDYKDKDIKLEVVLKAGKTTETKTFNCAYNNGEARRSILKAMDSLLSSHAEYLKL